MGKTLFVRTLGRVLGCQFGRIQFTADLMPSDITGAPIFDMKTQEFRFRPGPVFTQLLLADEINRSPAKTHAALLEIMQEYRVTVERHEPQARSGRSWCWPRRTRSNRKAPTTCPRPSSTASCSSSIADYPSAEEEIAILKHAQPADRSRQPLDETLQTVTTPEEIVEITTRGQQRAHRRQAGRLHQQRSSA